MYGRITTMFICNMIRTDVGLYFKEVQQKVVPYGLMVTLSLANGKLAVFVALGVHLGLNPRLSE
jgi:hypothetical protein